MWVQDFNTNNQLWLLILQHQLGLSHATARLKRISPFFFGLTIISTSLLFFFRTRAIFNRDPWIVAFFAGLWLVVLGSCVAFIVAWGIFCAHSRKTRPYVAVATIIPLINDTLSFIAIACRLFHNSYARRTLENSIRFFVFGDYLPVFSKAMLREGQAYYLLVPPAMSRST